MDRTLTFTVPEADIHDSAFSKYTIKALLKSHGVSAKCLIALKKQPDGILLNKQPAFVNAVLAPGDQVTIHLAEDATDDKLLPVEYPLQIVYEDEDLCIVNKPAGMPIHPSQNNYGNTLANALAYYYAQQNLPFVFRCVNRLDKDTSGLTIIAKNLLSAGILGGEVSAKEQLTREYLAIVKGTLPVKFGTISAPIGRKPGSIIERQIDFENGETAVTHYQVVTEKKGYSLISLKLETGRTHQIRVHMKYLGFPLIGDYLYHPDMERINRQALHSHRLSFKHPITGEMLSFTAPLPEDMERIMR